MDPRETRLRVPRDHYSYYVGPDIPAGLRVEPGDEVLVETTDYFSGMVTSPSQCFGSISDLLELVPGLNPVSGPIAVAGAEPGDVLAVHVIAIKVGMLNSQAVTMIMPEFGGLCNPDMSIDGIAPVTKICHIEGYIVELPLGGRLIELPVQPMIGTIWTAPAYDTRYSFVYDAHNCGNIDCPELGPGRTIYLPVTVPEGMVSVGDVHACMGDGEITGMALETAADVRLRIDLVKSTDRNDTPCPRIDSDEMIGSVGCHFGRPLVENVKEAFRDLVLRLHSSYGFSHMDAYEMLGQVARVRTHQTLEDWNSAFVGIDRSYLA